MFPKCESASGLFKMYFPRVRRSQGGPRNLHGYVLRTPDAGGLSWHFDKNGYRRPFTSSPSVHLNELSLCQDLNKSHEIPFFFFTFCPRKEAHREWDGERVALRYADGETCSKPGGASGVHDIDILQ